MKLQIEDGATKTTLDEAAFPLAVGGEGSPFRLPDGEPVAAWLGLHDGEVFLQPEGAAQIVCNDVPLGSSHWIRPGDVVRTGAVRLLFAADAAGLTVRVDRPPSPAVPAPPAPSVERSSGATSTDGMGIPIRPIPFRPRALLPPPRPGRRLSVGLVIAAAAFVVAVAFAGLLSTSRVVAFEIEPTPDSVSLRGTWPALPLPGRFLVRPGRYVLTATKEGYVPLEKTVDVGAKGETLRFTLERSPGRVIVETGAVTGAEVALDGTLVGRTPLPAFDAPPGEREIAVRAEGYLPATEKLVVQGSGVEQKLSFELVANSAPVRLESRPAGATVTVDGADLGATPWSGSLGAGKRTLVYSLAGYRSTTQVLDVVAGSPLSPATVTMVPADVHLTVTSEPAGATVTIGGTWRGETPLELEVAPGRSHDVRLTKAGHEPAEAKVEAQGGERRTVSLALTALTGQVVVSAKPPDAELVVDGDSRGRADQTLTLTAVPHEIVIRKAGFADARTSVTPRPGIPQAVRVTLAPVEDRDRKAKPKPTLAAPATATATMKPVAPGRFEMGASRREPGRRTNEPLRQVELRRPALIGMREVTNAEFRRFRPAHDSGALGSVPLNMDSHPVVRVTWEDAALYCNFLSERESLPPFYVRKDGRLVSQSPPGLGYRLPTEAEWERASRYGNAGAAQRFPWGGAMPPPVGAGNYADRSARGLVPAVLEDYEDGHAGTSPTGQFAPGPSGLFDMGGNVAEWASDLYAINPTLAGGEVDPQGPGSGEFHVIRGSSFLQSTVSDLRLTSRDYGRDGRPDVGFRLARYVE